MKDVIIIFIILLVLLILISTFGGSLRQPPNELLIEAPHRVITTESKINDIIINQNIKNDIIHPINVNISGSSLDIGSDSDSDTEILNGYDEITAYAEFSPM